VFFEQSLQPVELCEKLSIYYKVPVVPGKTLLFFDEIQSCVKAIQSLRYFYEKMPQLHVVAAGSLLEFALGDIPSFGTGRIQSLFMYPLSFREFVTAVDGPDLAQMIADSGFDKPIDPVFHNRLLALLRKYMALGGMPAIVRRYAATGDMLACQDELDSLLLTIRDDFRKYRTRVPSVKMLETMRSVVHQAGGKFKYANIAQQGSHEGYKTALELLCMAGLVHRICHTAAQGIPLGAQVKDNRFKTFFLDMGLHQRILGLDIARLFIEEDLGLVNRGTLAEQFVCLELIAGGSAFITPPVYYWHREQAGSNAEVDFIIQKDRDVVPVKVKSGIRGSMRSLQVFLDERGIKRGIRLSQENYARSGPVWSMPLYTAGLLADPSFRLG